jgi:hypothetical protein
MIERQLYAYKGPLSGLLRDIQNAMQIAPEARNCQEIIDDAIKADSDAQARAISHAVDMAEQEQIEADAERYARERYDL